jgi:formate dehydrogenase maturation protein FdhE
MRRKYCPTCKGTHPLSHFGRNRQSADGLHYYCKACAAAKQRAWAAANPTKVRAMRAAYLERVHEQNANRDPYE